MQYNIGDRILYPMHGAGEIIGIEEKEILGEMQSYYVFKASCGGYESYAFYGKA